TDVFTMGATFKLRSGATQPEQTLEEHARSAMLAAAAAIIQPWLYKNFPRIIEQRLSAQLKERVEPIAAALNQQVADTINQRLEPAVGQRVAAAEEGLATALIQQVADAVSRQLEPAVSKHIAALEQGLATAVVQQV